MSINYSKDLAFWEQEKLKAEIEAKKRRSADDEKAAEIWEASIVYAQRQIDAIKALMDDGY